MKAAGGAEFRASTAQRMAVLADPGRRADHAAAAAWLVRRCELLWSRGYFSKSREADQGTPFGVLVLSTLAADYLYRCAAQTAAPSSRLCCTAQAAWSGTAEHHPASPMNAPLLQPV